MSADNVVLSLVKDSYYCQRQLCADVRVCASAQHVLELHVLITTDMEFDL